MPREDVKKLLRTKFMPHIWCPGCGHGIIMHAILRALADLKIPRIRYAFLRVSDAQAACPDTSTHARSTQRTDVHSPLRQELGWQIPISP